MNKTIHGLIAAAFAFACWCLWGMLTLASKLMLRVSDHPPAFTELCVGLRPLFVVLPVLAAAYCLYVWIRKTDPRRSWVPFFAATMGSLVVVMLPTLIAVWLPVIQFIGLAGAK
jgi:hypothetical protein